MQSWTFRISLAFLAILGLIPTSNPWNKQLSQQKFRFGSIITVWTLFQVFCPLILIIDILHTFSNIPHVQLSTLTRRFVMFTMLPVATICNTIARLVALRYCDKTMELILGLKMHLPSKIRTIQKRRAAKTTRTGRFFLFACILKIVVHLVKDLEGGLRGLSQDPKLPLYTLPDDGWIRDASTMFCLLCIDVSLDYSLGFVVIVGVVLLEGRSFFSCFFKVAATMIQ